MTAKYEKLTDLLNALEDCELKESDIRVICDNDKTTVEIGYWVDGEDEENPTLLYDGNGYYDIEELWSLIMPTARVESC